MLYITLLKSFGICFTYHVLQSFRGSRKALFCSCLPLESPSAPALLCQIFLASLAIWTTLPKKVRASDSKAEEAGLAEQLLFVCSDVRVVVFPESGKSVLSSGRKEKRLGGES